MDQELADSHRDHRAALADPLLVRQPTPRDRSGPSDHGLTEAQLLGDTARVADIVDRWGR